MSLTSHRRPARGLARASLIAALLALGCSRAEPRPRVVAESRAAGSKPVARALLEVAPAELPAFVRSRYRPSPDRRLLLALGGVAMLPSAERTEATASFGNGRWTLSIADSEVGSLPEVPGFADGEALLVARARALRAPSSGSRALPNAAVSSAVESLEGSTILRAVDSLAGGADDPAVVTSAAEAYVWLATLAVDGLDRADPLLARAWALVASERALDLPAAVEHEALVAEALGYQSEAVQIARALPAAGLVRRYLERDEAGVRDLCNRPEIARRCRYLDLKLLGERRDVSRFEREIGDSLLRRGGPWEAAALWLPVARFGYGPTPGRIVSTGVLRSAEAEGGSPDRRPTAKEELASPAGRTREFEAALTAMASRSHGDWLDRAAAASFYRAAFYAGLLFEARFHLDWLASSPAAANFASSITDPAPGTAAQLRRWLELLASMSGGSQNVRAVFEAAPTFDELGGEALLDLTDEIARRTAGTDPMRNRPIPAIFARLDTRPAHLAVASEMAAANLTSPGLRDRFLAAAVGAAPRAHYDLAPTEAALRGDRDRLRSLAADASYPPYARYLALDELRKVHGPGDLDFVAARLAELAAEWKDSTLAIDGLVDLETGRQRLAAALEAVQRALHRGVGAEDLGYAHLVAIRAGLLRRLGRLAEAADSLEPALLANTEEALIEGATIELARGHAEAGRAWATKALERYPAGSEAAALIAEAGWIEKDPVRAAADLVEANRTSVGAYGPHLAEAFAEVFAQAKEPEIRTAFEALAAAGVPARNLANVALELGRRGRLEVALHLMAGLHDPSPVWETQLRLRTFQAIRDASGTAAAIDWLRGAVPRLDKQWALELYLEREFEAVASLVTAEGYGIDARIVRILQAASLLQLGEKESPRRSALVAAVEADPGQNEFFVRGALFLLGKRDEASLYALYPKDATPASLGWILGEMVASRGDLETADAWFQVGLESGAISEPPRTWCFASETRWLTSGKSLERLSAEGRR